MQSFLVTQDKTTPAAASINGSLPAETRGKRTLLAQILSNEKRNNRPWLYHGFFYLCVLALMALDMILGPMRKVGGFAGTALEQIFLFLLFVAGSIIFSIQQLIFHFSKSVADKNPWISHGLLMAVMWIILIILAAAITWKTGAIRSNKLRWVARIVLLMAGITTSLLACFLSRGIFITITLVIFAAISGRHGRWKKISSLPLFIFKAGVIAAFPSFVYFAVSNRFLYHPPPSGSRVIFNGGAYDAVPTGNGSYLIAANDKCVHLIPPIGEKSHILPLSCETGNLRFFFDPSRNRVFLTRRIHSEDERHRIPFLIEFELPGGNLRGQIKAPHRIMATLGVLDPLRNRIYVITEFSTRMVIFDARSFSYLGDILIAPKQLFPFFPTEVDVNTQTGIVYISTWSFPLRIFLYDPETEKKLSRQGGVYMGIAVDERRNLIYVPRPLAGRIEVLDGSTLKLRKILPARFGVRDIELSPEGDRLYATLFLNGAVAILDTSGRARPRFIRVGRGPRGIHLDPHSGMLVISTKHKVLLIPVF